MRCLDEPPTRSVAPSALFFSSLRTRIASPFSALRGRHALAAGTKTAGEVPVRAARPGKGGLPVIEESHRSRSQIACPITSSTRYRSLYTSSFCTRRTCQPRRVGNSSRLRSCAISSAVECVAPSTSTTRFAFRQTKSAMYGPRGCCLRKWRPPKSWQRNREGRRRSRAARCYTSCLGAAARNEPQVFSNRMARSCLLQNFCQTQSTGTESASFTMLRDRGSGRPSARNIRTLE